MRLAHKIRCSYYIIAEVTSAHLGARFRLAPTVLVNCDTREDGDDDEDEEDR
jgi:hypothetical protein